MQCSTDENGIFNCSGRNLTALPVISNKGEVKKLNISCNKFTALTKENFDEFNALTELDISYNQLTSYSFLEYFMRKDQNLTIRLNYNKISSINVQDLEKFVKSTHIKRVTLQGNPIECSDNITRLLNDNKMKFDYYEFKCNVAVFAKDYNISKPKSNMNGAIVVAIVLFVVGVIVVVGIYFCVGKNVDEEL